MRAASGKFSQDISSNKSPVLPEVKVPHWKGEMQVAILPAPKATKMGEMEIIRMNPEDIVEPTDEARPA